MLAQGLAQGQGNGIGDQEQSRHFLHHNPAFVHEILEVEQALQVSESFFDLHSLEIDRQSVIRLEIGHDPHGISEAGLPDANDIHKYLAFVEDFV